MFQYAKGSPEAMAQLEKMRQGQEAARQRRYDAARQALGPDAPEERIEAFMKEAARAQRQAKAAGREMGRQQKIAAANLTAATAAAGPPPQAHRTHGPAPREQMFDSPDAEDLYNHPIFGSVAQPEGVTSVAVYRLPSDLPEHRGVTPGYLQSMPYDEFSEDAIRVLHGGGKFRAAAKDSKGRVVRSGDFTIAGRAKLYVPEEDEAPRGHSRIGAAFRSEQDDVPPHYRLYMEQQDKRMERLEALIEQTLTHRPPPSDEDKVDRRIREAEEKEEKEQKRHERRMAELKAELEGQSAKEAARLNAAQATSQAQAAAQADLLKTVLTSQATTNQALMTAVLSKGSGDGDGGTAKFLLPMIEGMGAMMKVQNSNFSSLFAVLKDSMGGEDNRTTGARVMDMIEKGVSGLWDKAGDGLLLQIVQRLGQPKQGAVPQSIPAGQAFQLPDGRVVPPEICAEFVGKYRALHKVDPSMEVCVAAFTDIMNSQQQAPQPAQIAGPQQQVQQRPITREEAEEFVRRSQQAAAEEATRAGRTTDEVQAAAKAAAQQAVAYLRSLASGQPQQAAPQPQAQPAAAHAAAPAPTPTTPEAAAALAAQQQAQAPPPPAPAAVEVARAQATIAAIQQQAQQVAPAPVEAPAPAAPPVTATAVVQAGPVAVPGTVAMPWMHRGFLQFAIDAFQARQHPVDFLFLALQQGKISSGAKLEVGKIYEDSSDDEPLSAISTKMGMLLLRNGVVIPEGLKVFESESGESWLDSFLFACGCSTRDEAMKRLKEEE